MSATDILIREKTFHEMKKGVGMTTAQKSKETRRIEMGSFFVLYIHPTIPTYALGSFNQYQQSPPSAATLPHLCAIDTQISWLVFFVWLATPFEYHLYLT